MREFSTPLTVEIPRPATSPTTSSRNAARGTRRRRLLPRRRGDGVGGRHRGASSSPRSAAVAKGLVAAGIEAGDRVALISKTRYEWTLLDYAIWFAGAVTVPIYETSSAEQIEWILSDSGAGAVVAEGAEHLPRVAERARRPAPSCSHVWSLDDNAVEVLSRLGADISDDELEKRRTTATPARPGHADLHLRHHRPPQGLHAHPRQLHVRARRRRPRAARALRGTTTPRPCCSCRWPTSSPGSSRSAAIKARVRLGHTADIKHLLADLGEFQPTFILAVPRVFEKVFNTASQQATADGKGRIFDRAADTAIAYSRALDARPGRRCGSAPSTRCSTGSSTPSCAPRSAALRVRRLRRRAARRAARPLLPRHRADRARGLRPHRDHRRADRQPARRARRSAPSAGRCPAPRSASPTTASCCSAAARSSPATGTTRRPPPRRSSATAGSTPATSARSTTRASSGSPAARRRSW